MKLRSARTGIVCLGILASVAAGCAQERDPINRVQADALSKSFFVGENLRSPADDPEFRMKAFNVGGTVGQEAYSIGEYSALDRVRWEITEKLLIARKAYEIAPGADNRGANKDPNGAIVAAYNILSHFDIKRAYNSTTGEELNVIEENTQDRAWYERTHMRVDWSQNVVDGPNDPTRYFSGQLGGIATPVAYTPSDPQADDAPHVDLKDGYFDVTNKFTVEPDTVQFPWGSIRRCQLVSFLTGSSTFDCNPQEAVVRLSFHRISADEDFEPFEDSVAWRDVVGNMGGDGDAAQTSFGTAPRTGWDPQYGYTDATTKRFKNVHELFVKSHQKATCTVDVDDDKNGTADACENATTGYQGHEGSRCDVHVGKCTIPVRDREVKTVAYFLNAEAPDTLQDQVDGAGKVVARGTLEDLTHSWNQLLEVSLAYRREVECRATGGDRTSCHAEYFEGEGNPDAKVMVSYGGWLIDKVKPQTVDKGKAVLTACHNPVRAYDPKVCGEPGTKARLGDQRKNFIVYWPHDSRAHYGGVAGVTPDPVTGEIRAASATIMGRSATYAAALQRDVIQLALGDLTMDQLVKGVPAQRYVESVKSGGLAAPGLTKALSEGELARRARAIDLDGLRAATGSAAATETQSKIELALAELERASRTRVDESAAMSSLARFDAVANKLRGSSLEANIVDSHWLLGATGANPATVMSQDVVQMASPLAGLDPARMDVLRAMHERSLGERGACFHDGMMAGPGSVYLASLAGYFKAKYGDLDAKARGERIYDELWREAVKGIGLHEIGHSLGLRHNFASSWDAPNFNPQYWQLRTAEGAANGACSDVRTGPNDSCMGPRYLDPMTPDEQGIASESRPGIDYFANTSTMEYQIERFGETVGLGTYDLHAMKALYGRVLETFDERVMPLEKQRLYGLRTFTQLSERDFSLDKDKPITHYTETARSLKVFDKARDCRPATEEEKATAKWRVVHGQVCSPAPKDHWSFDAFKSDVIVDDLHGAKWHVVDREGKDRVRWQYRYGEQYGAGGYMHTSMGDAGADIYELVHNMTQRFNLTYPWTYFRRGNTEYTTLSIPQAVSSQYFMKARAYHWQIARAVEGANPTDLERDDRLRPYAAAQTDLMTFLANAVLTPEPGSYAPKKDLVVPTKALKVFDVDDNATKAAFVIDISQGRYIGEDLDADGRGGSWNYQKFVSRAGFEVEKALAMMQIVDTRPTLFSISRAGSLDERSNMVSFRTDLPHAVDRLLGGVLSEDWEAIGPSVGDSETPPVIPLDFTLASLGRSPSDRVVFPNIGFKQQLQMAIFAAVFSRLGSDMTLIEKLRVTVDGDRAPKVPGTRQTQFLDPRTGYTYSANLFGSEAIGDREVDKGIASRMVAHANELVELAYAVKTDASGHVVRDAFGKPELETDASGAAKVKDSTKEKRLRAYVGLLDAIRQIGILLGDGPLGGGGNDD